MLQIIVTKFGGSSLSSAKNIRQACEIQLTDSRRRLMVVSAPGKRFDGDVKMTDLLIRLATSAYVKLNYSAELDAVLSRFEEIISGLGLGAEVLEIIKKDLMYRLQKTCLSEAKYMDLFKAAGEDNCAKIVAAYLNNMGKTAFYINPGEAGLVLSDEPGEGRVLQASYARLSHLANTEGIGVFPGFFGYDSCGEVVTFGRGGSDITGSVLAKAVGAALYENYTDVDNVFAVSPSFVKNPVAINQITYREMRELAYAGFTVLHQESLEPLLQAEIPINIKNTNNSACGGTLISCKRDCSLAPIAGIAAADDFCILTVGKYLMNREIGFGRRLFQLLEDENLSFDHAPSGIDTMSPIFKQTQLTPTKQARLLERIQNELGADFVFVTRDISIIMLVGEGLLSENAVTRAATVLSKTGISIEALNMSCGNPISIAIGVKAECMQSAVSTLYSEFFENK